MFKNSASLKRRPLYKISRAWIHYTCCLEFSSSAYPPGKPAVKYFMLKRLYQFLTGFIVFCLRQLSYFSFVRPELFMVTTPHAPLQQLGLLPLPFHCEIFRNRVSGRTGWCFSCLYQQQPEKDLTKNYVLNNISFNKGMLNLKIREQNAQHH